MKNAHARKKKKQSENWTKRDTDCEDSEWREVAVDAEWLCITMKLWSWKLKGALMKPAICLSYYQGVLSGCHQKLFQDQWRLLFSFCDLDSAIWQNSFASEVCNKAGQWRERWERGRKSKRERNGGERENKERARKWNQCTVLERNYEYFFKLSEVFQERN